MTSTIAQPESDTLLCAPLGRPLGAEPRLRAEPHGGDTYLHLAALFGALADPSRARIVHMLSTQELCTCDIAAVLGITDSAVSQHLRILRSLRLVRSRREGKFVYYALDDAHVTTLIEIGLTHQRHAVATESAISDRAQP